MTNSLASFLFVVLISIVTLSCAPDEQDPIKALYITGAGWHDYETQEGLFFNGENERLGDAFEWTIGHEGHKEPNHHVSILKEENWTDEYNLVVHNTGFGRVTNADYLNSFVEDYHGTPAVLIHSAVHSHRYAEPVTPWSQYMGQKSMWHKDLWGLDIEYVAADHPIMKDFPEIWANPDDKLYVIEEVWGDITPLARAYGVETEKFHTVTWTHEIDDTRMFATMMEYTNEVFESDVFLDTPANGIFWVTRRLDTN